MADLPEAQRRRWWAEQIERDAEHLHGFDPAEDEFRDPPRRHGVAVCLLVCGAGFGLGLLGAYLFAKLAFPVIHTMLGS